MFTIESNDPSRPSCIRLGGELTIYHAVELQRAVQPLIETGTDWEVDVAEVTELDTAGIQVLLASRRGARRAGGGFRLVGHSRAVIETLDAMNLAGRFGDPIVMSAGR